MTSHVAAVYFYGIGLRIKRESERWRGPGKLTSSGEIFSPPLLTSSLRRPVSVRKPSSSRKPWSPVWNHPPAQPKYTPISPFLHEGLQYGPKAFGLWTMGQDLTSLAFTCEHVTAAAHSDHIRGQRSPPAWIDPPQRLWECNGMEWKRTVWCEARLTRVCLLVGGLIVDVPLGDVGPADAHLPGAPQGHRPAALIQNGHLHAALRAAHRAGLVRPVFGQRVGRHLVGRLRHRVRLQCIQGLRRNDEGLCSVHCGHIQVCL